MLVSFQYKGIRLYSDIYVRNKVEEEDQILTLLYPFHWLSGLITTTSHFFDFQPMSPSSSNALNGLPWLAKDNFLEWQEQVMVYLQQEQITQYIEGWAHYLLPDHLTNLSTANQLVPATVQAHVIAVTAWRTAYDNWRIKDNMAMGVIKGTLHGQYLTYILHCTTSRVVWDAILSRLKMQNLGLAAHNTKQLLYNHPYLGGLIEEYLKHFTIMNKQLTCISKALPDLDVAHWMLENLLKEDPSWKSVISSFYMVNPDPDLVTSFQASVAICNHYNQLTALPMHSSSASNLCSNTLLLMPNLCSEN